MTSLSKEERGHLIAPVEIMDKREKGRRPRA